MFFWLRSAPDWWSPVFLYLTMPLFLCNLTLYALCVLQELNTICTWSLCVSEMCCQTLESDFGWGLPWAMVSAPRASGVSMSATGARSLARSLDPRHWDRNYVCPKRQLLRGPGWVRWVRDLAKPVFLIPAAGQQLPASSQNWVCDVCIHKLILNCTW